MPISLATTLGITFVFSSSSYLDVSVQRVRSSFEVPSLVGCPIRISKDQRLFAPPLSFSQLITSFFALQSLGILRMPLFVLYALVLFSLNQKLFSATFRLYYTCFQILLDNVFYLFLICFGFNMSMNSFRYFFIYRGGYRIRTDDPLLAKQVL